MSTRVMELLKDVDGRYRAVVRHKTGFQETISADQVIVAVGRAGLFWWREALRKLQVAYRYPRPSVGLRFELDAEWLVPAACLHPDFKATIHCNDAKFKSFCYCAGTGGDS